MGNEDTNQPGPSNSPPKDEGKKERSKDGFLDKAAAVVFQGLDDKARDQIRDLNNCKAITCNPAFFLPDCPPLKTTNPLVGS